MEWTTLLGFIPLIWMGLGIMDSDNIIMPDGDVNYIIYKGMKLYIKKGRNTSKRIMK